MRAGQVGGRRWLRVVGAVVVLACCAVAANWRVETSTLDRILAAESWVKTTDISAAGAALAAEINREQLTPYPDRGRMNAAARAFALPRVHVVLDACHQLNQIGTTPWHDQLLAARRALEEHCWAWATLLSRLTESWEALADKQLIDIINADWSAARFELTSAVPDVLPGGRMREVNDLFAPPMAGTP